MRRCATALAVLSIVAGLAGCGSKESPSAASFDKSSPSPAPTSSGATLALATSEVNRVAPALDKYFAEHGYATTLQEVAQSMVKANLALDPTDAVGGYQFDATAKKFHLCVENDAGSFATFDTATGKVIGSGLDGGCPQA